VVHRFGVQSGQQSTWFPSIDRTPQTWLPNVFAAGDSDFEAQIHRIYRTPNPASYVEVSVVR